MADLKKAKAMALPGCKVTYLPDKFAETTEELLVVGYDAVAVVNMVKWLGKPVQCYDVVRLLKENPSAHVAKCAPDDPLLLKYTEETVDENKSRKAAVEAVQKIKRGADPEEEIEDVGPSPRRRRSTRPAALSCGICMEDKDAYVALQPCGHAPFCTGCAATLMNDANCPMCRAHVTGTQRIFFS
jgi:hypothetical protein